MPDTSILYATRHLPGADAAFEQAVEMAASLDVGLTVLHVHREAGHVPHPEEPLALDRLVHAARRRGVSTEARVLGVSAHWTRELEAVDWSRWELVLKVAEPASPLRKLLGTDLDRRLSRMPGVPVWFVPAHRGHGIRVVMAGVDVGHGDHEDLNASVVRTASALAASAEARLYLVNVWSLVGETILTCPVRGRGPGRNRRAALRRLRARRQRRLEELARIASMEVEATPLMVRGLPDEALRKTARSLGADVMVLGTLARDGLEGALVGNLAERFVGRDGLGVLVLKPDGRVPRFAAGGVAA